jgi:hypothetical protein
VAAAFGRCDPTPANGCVPSDEENFCTSAGCIATITAGDRTAGRLLPAALSLQSAWIFNVIILCFLFFRVFNPRFLLQLDLMNTFLLKDLMKRLCGVYLLIREQTKKKKP